jgi:5'-deoxynucleotidase YfbR-like HD superfamily hydrolase
LDLIQAVLFHDVAERYLGDMPTPAKGEGKDLTRAYLAAEERTLALMGVKFHLTGQEQHWLDCVDKLELYLWCKDQEASGNRHTERMINYLRMWFAEQWETLPETLKNFINDISIWKRGSDFPPDPVHADAD